jgi:hypothetical protein
MLLLLHVGMGKTGTSTLQHALHVNRALLADAGILYPDTSTRAENHNALLGPYLELTTNVPREFLQPGTGFDTHARRGEALWATIEEQVDRIRPDTVILSGEYLFTQPESLLGPLRERLAKIFDDIQVVAYVRAPASHYLALVQQRVKASHAFTPPCRYQSPLRVCLTRQLHAFGPVIAVRPFERHRLIGADIVNDFLTTFVAGGADVAGRMTIEDLNESMSGEAMCIMQGLRRVGWPEQNDEFVPASTLVLTALTTQRDGLPTQSTARLRPGISAAIARAHAGDLDWLHDRFGVEFTADDRADTSMPEPTGWESRDLRDVLDVDQGRIDAVLYGLVKLLATQALAPSHATEPAVPARGVERTIAAGARSIRRLTRRSRP